MVVGHEAVTLLAGAGVTVLVAGLSAFISAAITRRWLLQARLEAYDTFLREVDRVQTKTLGEVNILKMRNPGGEPNGLMISTTLEDIADELTHLIEIKAATLLVGPKAVADAADRLATEVHVGITSFGEPNAKEIEADFRQRRDAFIVAARQTLNSE